MIYYVAFDRETGTIEAVGHSDTQRHLDGMMSIGLGVLTGPKEAIDLVEQTVTPLKEALCDGLIDDAIMACDTLPALFELLAGD